MSHFVKVKKKVDKFANVGYICSVKLKNLNAESIILNPVFWADVSNRYTTSDAVAAPPKKKGFFIRRSNIRCLFVFVLTKNQTTHRRDPAQVLKC